MASGPLYSYTPMHVAAVVGNKEIAKILVDGGVQIQKGKEVEGREYKRRNEKKREESKAEAVLIYK